MLDSRAKFSSPACHVAPRYPLAPGVVGTVEGGHGAELSAAKHRDTRPPSPALSGQSWHFFEAKGRTAGKTVLAAHPANADAILDSRMAPHGTWIVAPSFEQGTDGLLRSLAIHRYLAQRRATSPSSPPPPPCSPPLCQGSPRLPTRGSLGWCTSGLGLHRLH